MPRDIKQRPAAPLSAGKLGPKTAAWLAGVGVHTLADLRRAGAVATYVRLRETQPGVSLNLLYALVAALEGSDWRQVQRERKLELLVAVEDEQRRQAARRKPAARVRKSASGDELLALRNIGPAMRRDFDRLGIRSVRQLARCNPERLYARLQAVTGQRQDPCVLDTFAAAVHQARTGEALPWWHFSRLRKARG